MDKVAASSAEAVAGIVNGSSLAVGGLGLCGVPSVLIEELHRSGVTDLEAFSNNCGVEDWGLGVLLKNRQLRRVVASYLGGNKEFERQFLLGEIEIEPMAAMAGRVTIAEVEHLVDPGEIDADAVHLPGIYVQRVLPLTPEQAADKQIEIRKVQPRADG